MKWITNISNPGLRSSRLKWQGERELLSEAKVGTEHEDWKRYLEWLGQFKKGAPKATTVYTVEQLQLMGMIGLYEEEEVHVDV